MTQFAEHADLLDPAAMGKIAPLEMVATSVVEGLLSGRHRSASKGGCIEFAEHRPYSPGDEIRLLDWRVLARSDRYYVKQFEEETNLRAVLVVDASGSMGFGGGTMTKLRYAQVLSACLARLMLRQQDAVGLAIVDANLRRYVPPRSNPSHFGVLLDELGRLRAGGETSLADVLQELAKRIKRRGLIVICSDCFDDVEPLVTALHCLRARGHDMLLFHIMAPEELSFSFTKWSLFECLEVPGQRINLDPASIRKRYLQGVQGFLTELKAGCGRSRCDYAPATTDWAVGEMLGHYLGRRMSRAK